MLIIELMLIPYNHLNFNIKILYIKIICIKIIYNILYYIKLLNSIIFL